jgi:hypothetical protein
VGNLIDIFPCWGENGGTSDPRTRKLPENHNNTGQLPPQGGARGNFYPSLVETWDPPMEVTVPVHYPGKSIEKIPAF